MWHVVLVLVTLVMAMANETRAERSLTAYSWLLFDQDAYHRLLVERCRQAAPESVPAIEVAINKWQQKHGAAYQEIQRMVRAQAQTPEEKAYQASLAARKNALTQAALENVPMTELKQLCTQYPVTLDKPEYDWSSRLRVFQSTWAKTPTWAE